MSTVTTRLCRYGHKDCHQDSHISTSRSWSKANETRIANGQARRKRLIERVEEMLADGVERKSIASKVGYSDVRNLQRRLYYIGRGDLAQQLSERPMGRPPGPKNATKPPECAREDCCSPALWIEDKGLDPDDEPIAHWGAFCRRCQRREDMCEDLLFLLDPLRGGETDLFRVAGRLGFRYDYQGLEALRRELERYGRLDLRSLLHLDLMKDQRLWHAQGTVRSDINNHWVRLTSAGTVRAYDRMDADPGRWATTAAFS